jgi:hypothetical protein
MLKVQICFESYLMCDDMVLAGGDYGPALQAASACANWDIVTLLLENGADPNVAGQVFFPSF